MDVASSVPHKHQIISDKGDFTGVGYFSQGGNRQEMFEKQGI